MEQGRIELVNARLPLKEEGRLHRLVLEDGAWRSVERQEEGWLAAPEALPIGQAGLGELRGAATVDLQGRTLLPAFVDVHLHLDKAYSLPSVRNRSGTLREAIDNYRAHVAGFSKEELRERIMRGARTAASYGSLLLRTHLDVPLHLGRDVAMRSVEAALEARESLRDIVDLQLFPMFAYEHRRHEELSEFAGETLRMGVDGIGGAPHLTDDPGAGIEWALALAAGADRPVDLHLDETDDPQMRTIGLFCDAVRRHGYGGRATAGHLCSLSAMPQEDAERLIAGMREAGVGAVTLPAVNLYLQGRGDRGNVRRGLTRVKELLEAGVTVAAASDNIQDPFHPFGKGDLLQIGLIGAYAAHLAGEEHVRTVLRMLTEAPAALAGVRNYGVAPGCAASFVVLGAASGEELLQELPSSRWVCRRGGWISASVLRREELSAGAEAIVGKNL
ncbi:amidohydrolase family protein [Paenibacillus sp. FSL W8-1187]|uniref:amidohydrolase family protein n=1 Tax=unclassified Paenibacillus TaxID=185978 RepID=UPI00129AE097|nr:amidohydrolase family protein [Paenibacillus sp. B01]QGG54735.1 amidohydrolase family protein [Paenibacillus sp. B01]